MQIAIQKGISNKPLVFELSKEKVDFLMKFLNYLADNIVDEKSEDYQMFLESSIKAALKTKRVKSGNSLRQII